MKEQLITSRSKFALVLSAMKPLTQFLRTGFKNYTTKQTAFNAAMSYNLGHAIIGNYPEYSLDMSKLLISKGNLNKAINGRSTVTNCGLSINWDCTLEDGKDIAMVAILNTKKEEALFSTNGNLREVKFQEFKTPLDWENDNVSVFLAFISEDKKCVSDSTYLGDFIIKYS